MEEDICDPVQYCNKSIDDATIRLLLNRPCQPTASDFFYPTTNGRRCPVTCFFRTLPDGSKQQRKWLSCSKSSDKLFCIHCLLFEGPVSPDSIVWVQKGYNAWTNLARDLTHHESCAAPKNAEVNHMTWLFGETL